MDAAPPGYWPGVAEGCGERGRSQACRGPRYRHGTSDAASYDFEKYPGEQITVPEMTSERRDAFLRAPRIAKLATLQSDGSPTIVPVWFEWTGSEALVFTSATSPKVKRIRRDPRVALTVEEPAGLPEAWVTIEGRATLEAGGFTLAERLAVRYYDEVKAAAALATWGKNPEMWVLLRITPTRIRSSAP